MVDGEIAARLSVFDQSKAVLASENKFVGAACLVFGAPCLNLRRFADALETIREWMLQQVK